MADSNITEPVVVTTANLTVTLSPKISAEAQDIVNALFEKINAFIIEFQTPIIAVGATTITVLLFMFLALIIILGCNCVRSHTFGNLKKFLPSKATISNQYKLLKSQHDEDEDDFV